jgi:hypothetical protein
MIRLVACSLLVASCGGATFPRETRADNARADDSWLEGERCEERALVADLYLPAERALEQRSAPPRPATGGRRR